MICLAAPVFTSTTTTMRAPIIEIAGVVEFVIGVRVVANVAGLTGGRAGTRQTHDARRIGRPLEARCAAFKVGEAPRLAAVAGSSQICARSPSRVERNAMNRPSGDQRGEVEDTPSAV